MSRLRRSAGRLLCWVGTLGLIFLLVAMTPLAWYVGAPLRVPATPRPSDVIALFASGQIGTDWVTPDAAQRLLGALDLYRRHYAPVIVTSGSQHALGLFQAELLATWLRRAGVPEEALLIENHSGRTYDSVLELRRIMAAHGWHSAVIVTSQMDVPRIAMVCDKLGAGLGFEVSFLGVPVERPPKPGSLLYWSNGFPVLYHALYEYAGMLLYRMKGWI